MSADIIARPPPVPPWLLSQAECDALRAERRVRAAEANLKAANEALDACKEAMGS